MKVRRLLVAIVSIGFVGTCSQFTTAQLSKWVSKAGGSIKTEAGNFANTTKKAGRNISNSFPKLGGGNSNRSTLSQAVGPTMDRNGNIWSGGGNASVGKGKRIGKAKVIHNPKTGKASYFSNYSNIYGTVSPTKRPAPRYDRQPQSHRDIVIEPAKVIQKISWSEPFIDPSSGKVYKTKFVNGKKRGHVKLGDAQLYYHNGRAYYSAFGKSVWKKAPVANVPKMNTEGNGVKIGGMNANQFHKLNGNEKIAVGLGHLLSEIIKK